MAYAEQKMSGNRLTAIVIVALIHIAVGYALVTGLAYEAATKIMKKVTTVDIKDEPKPPPPPPPPPQDKAPPPPIVAPPPPVNVSVAPPAITTVATPPPVAPPAPVLAPPAPQAPPAPTFKPVAATAKGDPSSWMSSDDYPQRAIREQRAGTVGFTLTIGPNGRATACTVTSSSGSQDLDDAACKLSVSRGRFSPPKDDKGQPTTGTWNSRFKWQLPKD